MPYAKTNQNTLVNVISTPPAFWSIERLGRRPLLIWGALGMLVSQFIIAIVGTVALGLYSTTIVLIVFICIYIFLFASTWGPVCWTVCGEIYPLAIRSKAVAICTASNWLWNFIIGYITPYLVDEEYANLGPKVFYIFGSCCFAAMAFAHLFVYETRRLQLEEVDRMMVESTPRTSGSWRPSEASGPNDLERNKDGDEEAVSGTATHLSRNSELARWRN